MSSAGTPAVRKPTNQTNTAPPNYSRSPFEIFLPNVTVFLELLQGPGSNLFFFPEPVFLVGVKNSPESASFPSVTSAGGGGGAIADTFSDTGDTDFLFFFFFFPLEVPGVAVG